MDTIHLPIDGKQASFSNDTPFGIDNINDPGSNNDDDFTDISVTPAHADDDNDDDISGLDADFLAETNDKHAIDTVVGTLKKHEGSYKYSVANEWFEKRYCALLT